MQYEVEIKSLLGTQEAAEQLAHRLQQLDPECKKMSHTSQRNHYFTGDHIGNLADVLTGLSAKDIAAIANISANATHISVRTRQNNDDQSQTILVIKGAKGEGSANHAVERMEFEKKLPIAQNTLDQLLVDNNFDLQAKWQAERDKYSFHGATVEVIFSPGYGYLSEVEYISQDQDHATAEGVVRGILAELGLVELSGERLERMFAHYNAHWQEYYDTRNVFTVE